MLHAAQLPAQGAAVTVQVFGQSGAGQRGGKGITPGAVGFVQQPQADAGAYAIVEPKELFVVPGATHVDLYDQPEYLKITLPKLDTFFKQYLK